MGLVDNPLWKKTNTDNSWRIVTKPTQQQAVNELGSRILGNSMNGQSAANAAAAAGTNPVKAAANGSTGANITTKTGGGSGSGGESAAAGPVQYPQGTGYSFDNPYTKQRQGISEKLNGILAQIENPEKFNYEFNGDNLFKYYADIYTQKGKQASMDAMGQAAALTGGYGNSYAQNAGQQAYQQYLTGLYDQGMNLRDRAYQEYADRLNNRMNLYGQLSAQEQNMMQMEMAQNQNNQQLAANYAASILANGQMPSPELLSAAGLTYDDAIKMMAQLQASGGGGGGGRSRKKSTEETKPSTQLKVSTPQQQGITHMAVVQENPYATGSSNYLQSITNAAKNLKQKLTK